MKPVDLFGNNGHVSKIPATELGQITLPKEGIMKPSLHERSRGPLRGARGQYSWWRLEAKSHDGSL